LSLTGETHKWSKENMRGFSLGSQTITASSNKGNGPRAIYTLGMGPIYFSFSEVFQSKNFIFKSKNIFSYVVTNIASFPSYDQLR
jgi:hypothetical protein